MKLITLYIANRLDHVVDFDAEAQSAVETYIVERKEVGEPAELFAFYHKIGDSSNTSSPALYATKSKKQEEGNGKNIIYQNNEGQSALYIKSMSAQKDDSGPNKSINIDILLSPDKDDNGMTPVGLEDAGLSFDTTSEHLWVMSLDLDSNKKDPVIINITLRLELPKKSLEQKVKLCVARKCDIEDIVLDFGSEASQTASYSRNEKQTAMCIRSLFKEMKALLSTISHAKNSQPAEQDEAKDSSQSLSTNESTASKNHNSTAGDSYVQKDNDPNFFRSVFYAKKRFTHTDAGHPVPKLDASDNLVENQIIKMLTTQTEAQDLIKSQGFIQIPNVKITQFGGVEQPKVGPEEDDVPINRYGNGYFYRASINHFILNALLKVNKSCISLYVLMPNVYSPLNVIKHLGWIRDDVEKLINENEKLKTKIKAVELSAVSESDASLLGAISIIQDNSTDIVEPGNYIIIDAGKGTLDFSAIKYEKTDEGPRVHSIYRSGIIGAGNALTYACLFAILADYMSESNIDNDVLIDFVYENILGGTKRGQGKGGGDLANILKLMQAVERYKIRIGTKNSKPDDSIHTGTPSRQNTSLTDIEMTSITDFIDEMTPAQKTSYKPLSSKAQKFVTETINLIVNEVYKHLSILKFINYKRIDRVIFAGRGFCLPEFKRAMKEKLEELQKQLTEGKGNLLEELIYIKPDTVVNEKSVCLYIRNAIQKGHYNNHMTSIPVKVQLNSSQSQNATQLSWLVQIQKKLGFGKKGDNHQVNLFAKAIFSSRSEIAYHQPGNTIENGMVDGYTLDLASSDDIIMIGGTLYRIEKKGEVTFFFSSDKILYRYKSNDKGKIEELDENGVDVQSSPLIFGTLFPNVAVKGRQNVCLPYDPELCKREEESKQSKQNKQKKKKSIATGGDENEEQIEPNASVDNLDNGNNSATNRAHQLADEL